MSRAHACLMLHHKVWAHAAWVSGPALLNLQQKCLDVCTGTSAQPCAMGDPDPTLIQASPTSTAASELVLLVDRFMSHSNNNFYRGEQQTCFSCSHKIDQNKKPSTVTHRTEDPGEHAMTLPMKTRHKFRGQKLDDKTSSEGGKNTAKC